GRMLIKLDHFSQVNLIADFRAVPELLQDEVKPGAICQALSELFNEGERRAATLDALALVRERLGEPGAADRVAEMILALLANPPEEEAQQVDEPEQVVIAPGPLLDLHHFSPKELAMLVPDFLEECQENGIFEVRIIHGKGSGQLRRSVHALLERNPRVAGFRSAAPQNGGWGATEVLLKRPNAPEEEDQIAQ
ncbi:MAG TPA: Smr/MutS family protein, partial [Desulforhopalus sp.]|nr:Smr/MutS family protein [Desulforhopalus sp.]